MDRRFKRHYWRLGRLLLGPAAMPGSWRRAEYDDARATEMEDRVRLDAALASYTRLVVGGEEPGSAYLATMRSLAATGDLVLTRAWVEGMAPVVPTELVRVGRGVCLYRMRRYDVVWDQLAEVPPAVLARYAMVEAVDTALAMATPEAAAVAREVVADPSLARTAALPRLVGRFLVAGQPEVARSLYDEANARDVRDPMTRRLLDNLSRWLEDPAPLPDVPAERIRIGVFDYHHPDLVPEAGNVGDHIQTLSLLGNLARFQNVRFHGSDGLGKFAEGLRDRVRPELWLDGPAAEVELLPVSRDYSEGDPIPKETWIVAFGWHMHGLYRIRFGLPYHPNLRPIFVAFHLNRIRALTPTAIDYLRTYGPIGCRDWTTVDLLLSAGVDAFFTGCITSTVNAVFPDRDDDQRDRDTVVAAIDVPAASVQAKRPVEEVTHFLPEWHTVDLAGGLRSADALLATYLRRYHRIVTSRLHSYLPATSLGVPVEFRPKVPGDVRFAGLAGMQPDADAFLEMRDGIRELLAEVFGLVMAGVPSEEVYARWRELTADRVAQARARLKAPAVPIGGGVDVAAAVAAVRATIQCLGPHEKVDTSVSDIAVSLDRNYRGLLPVTLESLTSNARGPLRLFVTARGLDAPYREWLSASFPEVPFTFLTYDDVDYGRIARMLGHVSVATMDRLLLPEVLTHVDRVTYVDIDTVTLGDVTELAGMDLGGHPVAGRTERYSATETWRSAGNQLGPAEAYELRRTMAAAHDFDFNTFNAGVMVLDLDRMRRDRFVERFVPMAGRFGLHDQDVLNAYTGPHRAELDPRWNSFPVAESLPDPRLLHYAGAGKPWEDLIVPGGHWWRLYAEQFAARVGAMPDAD